MDVHAPIPKSYHTSHKVLYPSLTMRSILGTSYKVCHSHSTPVSKFALHAGRDFFKVRLIPEYTIIRVERIAVMR